MIPVDLRTADRVIALAGHPAFEGIWHDGEQARVSASLWWPTGEDGLFQTGASEFLDGPDLDAAAEQAVGRIRAHERWFTCPCPKPALFRLTAWALLSHPHFMGLWREVNDRGALTYVIELATDAEPVTISHRTLLCAVLLALDALPHEELDRSWDAATARFVIATDYGIAVQHLIAQQDGAFAFDCLASDAPVFICPGRDGTLVVYLGTVRRYPRPAPAPHHGESRQGEPAAA